MSSYDQNLLDEAPKATRAQLQEGYSVDLLQQRSPSARNPPPSQTPQPALVSAPLTPGITESGSGEKLGSPEQHTLEATTPKTSFWRTRNGIITIVVIVLAVIGAIVGGAVGGTRKPSNNKSVGNMATGTPTSSGTNPFSPTTASPVASATQAIGGGGGGNGSSSSEATMPTVTTRGSATTTRGQNSGGSSTMSM